MSTADWFDFTIGMLSSTNPACRAKLRDFSNSDLSMWLEGSENRSLPPRLSAANDSLKNSFASGNS